LVLTKTDFRIPDGYEQEDFDSDGGLGRCQWARLVVG
jgi:hypothetical protein